MTIEPPRYVEIETSRYCNRKCGWCPNGEYSARRTQELMQWELFIKILAELSEFRYSGWLAFHNYNEPLFNSRLIEEVARAHLILPRSRLSVFTNGDRLSAELLDDLRKAGLSYLRVTLYPSGKANLRTGETDSYAIACWLRAKRLDGYLNWSPTAVRQGTAFTAVEGSFHAEVIYPDLQTYNWRGGTAPLIRGAVRVAPCFMTIHSASIDYQGRLKMCCNVFPEAMDHKQYVVGNLREASFQALWCSESMQTYRAAHARADWSCSAICLRCSHQLPATQTSPNSDQPGPTA